MARQIIDTTTNNGSYIGDPAKTAFEKTNANFAETYPLAEGAFQKTGGTVTGPLVRPGVQNQVMFQVQNSGTDVGIGGDFASWSGNRTPALQLDAMVNTLAYMPLRVTHWGAKHLFAMEVYEGGSAVGAVTQMGFHFAEGTNRHIFYQNGSATFLGSLTQNSDYRIKDEQQAIDSTAAADGLRKLVPITYVDNRFPDDGRRSGWIAHSLQEAGFGIIVKGEKDATKIESVLKGDTTPYSLGTEPEGYEPPVLVDIEVPELQNVDYIGMSPFLHAGWIEHDNRIKELERKIEELTAIIDKNDHRI